MPTNCDARAFLQHQKARPIIDVRSPSEFAQGHIPGAVNVPLFDDAERAEVGTTYRKSGRQEAINLGLNIVGPKLKMLVQAVQAVATDNKVSVHCWRGGMRSESVAWLLEQSDFQTTLLEGGYKSFRQEVFRCFTEPRNVIILGGLTGTGKTRLLEAMCAEGEQVVDLEGLASHRGSAFGSINNPPQPTVEQFENNLFQQWRALNPDSAVWMENESRTIGKIVIPAAIWDQMRVAPVVVLEVARSERNKFLVQEYGNAAREEMELATTKIKKRLGNLRFQQAMEAIANNELEVLTDILLDYYDRGYSRALEKYPLEDATPFPLNSAAELSAVPQLQKLGDTLAARKLRI